MLTITCLFGVFILCCSANAANNCTVDDIQVQQNFDITKYMGKWYEIEWVHPFDVDNPWDDYSQAYTMYNDSVVAIKLSARNSTGTCLDFTNYLIKTNIPGRLIYKRRMHNNGTPYWVIKTDYTNFAVVYGCHEKFLNGTCNKAFAKVWSRTKTLSKELLKEGQDALDNLCITDRDTTKHSDNKYCDSNAASIPVIQKYYHIFVLLLLVLLL